MADPPGSGVAAALWRRGAAVQEAIRAHPFVTGLGDGSLSPARYRFYLCQDAVFLADYVRVLALAAAAEEAPGDVAAFADLLSATVHGEAEALRAAAADAGVGAAELAAATAAPFTFAYTRHLLAVARGGSAAEIAAALLPCQWGYADLAVMLAGRGCPTQPAYAAWIAAYAGPAYQETAQGLCALCDRLGAGMGSAERARAEAAFLGALRCEYLFWDGCWREQAWPV